MAILGVGAGGTSVASWLAGRVGPSGRVLATDIDTSWAAPAAGSVVEVLRHDVGRDEPPGDGFDLVHARLVLVHVADRERALRAMADSLRLGGWLLMEDADPALQPLICLDEYGPEQELANRLRAGFRSLLAARGADSPTDANCPGYCGRRDWPTSPLMRTSRSLQRPATSWRLRRSGKCAAVWSRRGWPPMSRSIVTWRILPPAASTSPPLR